MASQENKKQRLVNRLELISAWIVFGVLITSLTMVETI